MKRESGLKDKYGQSRADAYAAMSRPLEKPIVPDHGRYIWDWFWSLNNARQYSEGGASVIPFSEIESWIRCTGNFISGTEVEILKDMDVAFVEQYANEVSYIRERDK